MGVERMSGHRIKNQVWSLVIASPNWPRACCARPFFMPKTPYYIRHLLYSSTLHRIQTFFVVFVVLLPVPVPPVDQRKRSAFRASEVCFHVKPLGGFAVVVAPPDQLRFAVPAIHGYGTLFLPRDPSSTRTRGEHPFQELKPEQSRTKAGLKQERRLSEEASRAQHRVPGIGGS